MSEQLALSDKPHNPTAEAFAEGASETQIPEPSELIYADPNQIAADKASGNIIEGDFTVVSETPHTPEQPQPEATPQYAPFVPNPHEQTFPKVTPRMFAEYKIADAPNVYAAERKTVTPPAEAQPKTAETIKTPEQLRQTFMNKLQKISDNAEAVDAKGYKDATLAELEYAVLIAARNRQDKNVKTLPTIDSLRREREQNSELEKMGVTDTSVEAIRQRDAETEAYQKLLSDLFTEASQFYGDAELRSAGFDWANGDELTELIKSARGKTFPPLLPNLALKRIHEKMPTSLDSAPKQQTYQGYVERANQLRAEYSDRQAEQARGGSVRNRRRLGGMLLQAA
jgi:hypothetical protein